MKYKLLLILLLFSFSFISQNLDDKYFQDFLKEESYINKKVLFINGYERISKEYPFEIISSFLEKELKKTQENIENSLYIKYLIAYIHNYKGNYKKSIEIANSIYFGTHVDVNRDLLCEVLGILDRNYISLDGDNELQLLIISNEKLKICNSEDIYLHRTYAKLKLYGLALKAYKQKYKKDLTSEDDYEKGRYNSNVGYYLYKDNKLDSALIYYNKGLNLIYKYQREKPKSKPLQVDFWVGLIQGNLARVYTDLKQYKKAYKYAIVDYHKSIKFYKKRKWSSKNKSLEMLAECKIHLGDFKTAKLYIDTLKTLNKKDYYSSKALYFDKKNQKDSSSFYLNKIVNYQDSIYSLKINNFNKSVMGYTNLFEENFRKREELLKKEEKNQKNKDLLLIVTISLIFSSIIIILLFYLYHQKNNQKTIILKQKEIIEEALNENKTLLKELQHRVKNNLQMMISLFNLQLNKLPNKELKDVFQFSINRVKTISKIHEKLYNNKSLNKISLNDYTQSIVKELKEVYFNLNSVNFKLKIKDDLFIHIDQTQTLGLIINELITNSKKHAFSDSKKENNIIIIINKNKSLIHFNYIDNGSGFNVKEVLISKSLGLGLIKRLVNQLGTNATINAENGMNISFSFKNKIE
jgi:two-component sensor histidine kinase